VTPCWSYLQAHQVHNRMSVYNVSLQLNPKPKRTLIMHSYTRNMHTKSCSCAVANWATQYGRCTHYGRWQRYTPRSIAVQPEGCPTPNPLRYSLGTVRDQNPKMRGGNIPILIVSGGGIILCNMILYKYCKQRVTYISALYDCYSVQGFQIVKTITGNKTEKGVN
jgi:hypothetical protein